MSLPLLKATLKRNYMLFFIFLGVLTMYTTIIIGIYDPEDTKALMDMIATVPQGMMDAFGFTEPITDLTSLVASWLYGLLMLAFPMVYSILLCNRLMSKSIDSGSMACLLATPDSRVKIIVTKGVYALLSIGLLQMLVFVIGSVFSEYILPGHLDILGFFHLNLTTMFVNMLVFIIAFFFSSFLSEYKYAIGFSSGVPIMFMLFKMLGDASETLEIFNEISIFGWYSPIDVAREGIFAPINYLYIILILGLFIASVVIFKYRKLSI